jgi:hypothetical protein
MNRYSAQKQYWKAKQTKQDKEKIADVVLLQKLQVCMRLHSRASARQGYCRPRACEESLKNTERCGCCKGP